MVSVGFVCHCLFGHTRELLYPATFCNTDSAAVHTTAATGIFAAAATADGTANVAAADATATTTILLMLLLLLISLLPPRLLVHVMLLSLPPSNDYPSHPPPLPTRPATRFLPFPSTVAIGVSQQPCACLSRLLLTDLSL